MKRFSLAFLLSLVTWNLTPGTSHLLYAQQPSTNAAVFPTNSSWVNGIAPGYRPSAGSGLTLNIGGGTVMCPAGTIVNYTAGTLTMTNATTNYVYLDLTASCAPASNTTGFTSSGIPIATVVTSGG